MSRVGPLQRLVGRQPPVGGERSCGGESFAPDLVNRRVMEVLSNLHKRALDDWSSKILNTW